MSLGWIGGKLVVHTPTDNVEVVFLEPFTFKCWELSNFPLFDDFHSSVLSMEMITEHVVAQ